MGGEMADEQDAEKERAISNIKFVSWTQFGQLLGSFSIAASLIIVAWEMKQSRDIAESQLHMSRNIFDASAYTSFDYSRTNPLWEKIYTDGHQSLSIDDYDYLWAATHFMSLGTDTAHFHWQKGLMSDEVWQAYLTAYFPNCHPNAVAFLDKVWNQGFGYRHEFVAAVNQRRQEVCRESEGYPEQGSSKK